MKALVYSSILSLFCTTFVFFIHTLEVSNSMINKHSEQFNTERDIISNEYLKVVVDLHNDHPAFVKRPVTTYLIEAFAENSFLTIGGAFTFINFLFLFICGLLVFYLSRILLENDRTAYVSMVLFFFSFTILFAFFPVIYTYDEPIQYCLIAISFIALYREKWIVYILSFSFSLITRESGMILLPAIALFLIPINFKGSNIISIGNLKKILVIVFPVVVYGLYLFVFFTLNDLADESKSDFIERFAHFNINFKNQQYSIESLTSLFLAVGLPIYILYWYTLENKISSVERKLIKAFLLTLIINSIVVLTTTLARETRLFALPMVFLWPILGKYFQHEFLFLRSSGLFKKMMRNWIYVSFSMFLIIISVLIFDHVYQPTQVVNSSSFQDEYFLLILTLIIFHFSFRNYIKRYSRH